MKKLLTDVMVAKALGWTRKRGLRADFNLGYSASTELIWHSANRARHALTGYLPKFTTSLDVSSREVERLGLCYAVAKANGGKCYVADVWKSNPKGSTGIFFADHCKTAELALVTALVKYAEAK